MYVDRTKSVGGFEYGARGRGKGESVEETRGTSKGAATKHVVDRRQCFVYEAFVPA